ncbi:MAG: hypothetical protein R2761_23555 [Acidimicrobiales bacterium]
MPAAGQRVLALDFTDSVSSTDATAHLNISTTPALGTPGVNVTFTAPTSGKVMVHVGASIVENGGATVAGVIDYRVRLTNSSGTIVYNLGSVLRRLVLFGNAQSQEATRTSYLSGLTPGQVYYVEMLHASYGTQVDLYGRTLTVVPLPA